MLPLLLLLAPPIPATSAPTIQPTPSAVFKRFESQLAKAQTLSGTIGVSTFLHGKEAATKYQYVVQADKTKRYAIQGPFDYQYDGTTRYLYDTRRNLLFKAADFAVPPLLGDVQAFYGKSSQGKGVKISWADYQGKRTVEIASVTEDGTQRHLFLDPRSALPVALEVGIDLDEYKEVYRYALTLNATLPQNAFRYTPPADALAWNMEVLTPLVKPGAQIPNATLATPDGATVNVRTLTSAHKATIITFWASWCGPCLRELPELNARLANFAAQDIGFLAVNDGDDGGKVTATLKRNNLTVPVALNGKNGDDLINRLGVYALPTLLIVDKDGKIIASSVGYTPNGLADILEKAGYKNP